MRGPITPPGSPPPSPRPEQEEERSYNGGGRYVFRTVGIRGPHTPPGSPPPSPIHVEGEDYSGRQVMTRPASNSPTVMVASQNSSPDTEGFSSEGQIAGQMTRRRNQNYLPVNQLLLPSDSESSIFHGRPEASSSQNHDEPKNGPPRRPQQYRRTKYEYRSPSNLRNRKEKRLELKSRKKMLKQQVMQPPWLKCDNSHVVLNQTLCESIAYTPSVPTTSSTAAGAAPQTPEKHIDDTGSAFQAWEIFGGPLERVGRPKPRE